QQPYFENFFNHPLTSGAPLISQADLKIHPPYNQQWNLTVQRELARNMSAQIAYVANKGTHIDTEVPFNVPVWVNGTNSGRPQPYWNGSNYTNRANSIYHALQASVENRFSSGLQLMSNFTWSKLIDNGSFDDSGVPGQAGVQNPWDLSWDRGLASMDVEFRWVTNAVYDLPFGRGKKFGADIPRGLDYAVGGWRLAVIGVVQSGSPFTPSAPSFDPFSSGGAYGTRPDRNGSGKLSNPTIQQW